MGRTEKLARMLCEDAGLNPDDPAHVSTLGMGPPNYHRFWTRACILLSITEDEQRVLDRLQSEEGERGD